MISPDSNNLMGFLGRVWSFNISSISFTAKAANFSALSLPCFFTEKFFLYFFNKPFSLNSTLAIRLLRETSTVPYSIKI